MADQNLNWVSQAPHALLGVLQKMLRHPEKLVMKYNTDKEVKVEDHLEKFYLHLHMLEVQCGDVACIIFPCTLDGRSIV